MDGPFGYNCTDSLSDLPEDGDVALGCIILVGMFISYLFQIVSIIRRKNSEGISSFYLLLGTLNAFTQMDNAIVYQFDVLACCPVWNAQDCQKQLLKLYQLMLQFSCLATIFTLFLIYFPRHKVERQKEWKHSLISACVCVVGIACFSATHALLATQKGVDSDQLDDFADTLGYFGVAFILSQFVPQIVKTIREKSAGAFSIPMLTIQTPGSFLFAFFLATGHNPQVSTWLPNLVTGCLQTVLWVSAVYFYCKNRKKNAEAEKLLKDSASDETSALLSKDSTKVNA